MISDSLATIGMLGTAAVFFGALLAIRFRQRPILPPPGAIPVTILKPLHGDEPALEEALASFARIAYPSFQMVVGVQDPADPALAVVERVRRQFPALDLAVVADARLHGANRKVSNLINMLPAARHDILVFSDSDLHVAPDYLNHLVAALDQPGCGLATTVCTGRAVRFGPVSLAARLGAMQISHSFLPSVMISRWLGREDALGTTMALHRKTLARAGGLERLLPHLADDQVLGRRVRSLGLSIALADSVPVASVMEESYAALWRHELRWARTIRALEPVAFLLSLVQFPLFWIGLACVVSDGDGWTLALFVACWVARAACAFGIDRAGGARHGGWREWLMWPARDILSAVLILASFCGSRVTWRGHVMRADAGRGTAPSPAA
jgi:ceramide glucosyltransferase